MDNNTPNQMIVEYERTVEDIIEFNLFHMSHSPSIRKQTLITQIIVAVLVFIGSLVIGYLFHQETKALTSFDYIVALVVSISCFYAVPPFNRAEVRRGFRKATSEGDNKAILGRHTVSLTKDNIFIKTQVGESKYIWSSINKVMQNDKYVFLYVSSINAIMIPVEAFTSNRSLLEFLDYVNTCREQN